MLSSSTLYAAIDLGSNSFHMLVVREVAGSIQTLARIKRKVRLAAGLGAIALSSGDVVTVGFLKGGTVATVYGPSRGQASLPRLFGYLEGLEPGGNTDLNRSLREYSIRPRRAGLLILISDLLTADGYESGLRQLLGRGHDARRRDEPGHEQHRPRLPREPVAPWTSASSSRPHRRRRGSSTSGARGVRTCSHVRLGLARSVPSER